MIDTLKCRRLLSGLLLALCMLVHVGQAEELRSRPNILFILTDDHRSDCLSVTGNDLANTPNIDRIAKSGTRFRNAFVTLAICSPSRAACLSGQYGSANRSNVHRKRETG